MALNKIEEALKSIVEVPAREAMDKALEKISEAAEKEKDNKEVYELLYSCLDITSLSAADTDSSISEWVEKVVNDPSTPPVAAVCVYPARIQAVKSSLGKSGVKIASVCAGFPASQTLLDIKVFETRYAVQEGAEEVDVVLNLGCFFDNKWEEVVQELSELKDYARGAQMKVILEVGAMKSLQQLREAAIIALFSGADFLKTSTGKEFKGADYESVYLLCTLLKSYFLEFDKKVGIKVSGGIKTAEQAIMYYSIVREMLGDEWLTPELFRIGASSLESELRKHL